MCQDSAPTRFIVYARPVGMGTVAHRCGRAQTSLPAVERAGNIFVPSCAVLPVCSRSMRSFQAFLHPCCPLNLLGAPKLPACVGLHFILCSGGRGSIGGCGAGTPQQTWRSALVRVHNPPFEANGFLFPISQLWRLAVCTAERDDGDERLTRGSHHWLEWCSAALHPAGLPGVSPNTLYLLFRRKCCAHSILTCVLCLVPFGYWRGHNYVYPAAAPAFVRLAQRAGFHWSLAFRYPFLSACIIGVLVAISHSHNHFSNSVSLSVLFLVLQLRNIDRVGQQEASAG